MHTKVTRAGFGYYCFFIRTGTLFGTGTGAA